VRIILTGPPGAGKGTQAQLLSTALQLPHISTGDLFRSHITRGTELGQTAKSFLDAGELVPDEVTIGMVADRLAADDTATGFILDGFPRTVTQATALDELLGGQLSQIDAVLDFSITDDVVVARMLARGRADDTEDVIRRRLRVYHDETRPLLEYYSPLLLSVDAEDEVDVVYAHAIGALSERGRVAPST
jgi:adenylate kinase